MSFTLNRSAYATRHCRNDVTVPFMPAFITSAPLCVLSPPLLLALSYGLHPASASTCLVRGSRISSESCPPEVCAGSVCHVDAGPRIFQSCSSLIRTLLKP